MTNANHLRAVYQQESAAADEFAKNTAVTAREAGWISSLYNVAQSIEDFKAAVKYDGGEFADFVQLARGV